MLGQKATARGVRAIGLNTHRHESGLIQISGQRPQSVVLRATGPGTRCSSHRPQHSPPRSGLIQISGQRPQSVVLRATGPGTRCSSHRPQHSSPHSVQIRSSGHRPQRVVLGRKASARGVRAIGLNTHRRLVDLFTALANRSRHIVRACHVWEMSIENESDHFLRLSIEKRHRSECSLH